MPGGELKKASFIIKFISADHSSFESQIHNGKKSLVGKSVTCPQHLKG